MQGFYRVGDGQANNGAMAAEQFANGTTQLNAYLFANEVNIPLMSIMEEAKEGTAPNDNYYTTPYGYIPQELAGASAFFSEGCYMHELEVEVTDGTLQIGIEKTVASKYDWTCFDNFRLTYMGICFSIDDKQESFYLATDRTYDEISYTRNFKNTNWQALYVPFEIPYGNIADDFDVAYINDVHQFDDDDDGIIDDTMIEAIKIKRGTLKANYPYLIRAKEKGEKAIIIPDATIYATEENSIDCSSVFSTYTFTGTYTRMSSDELPQGEGYYALSGGLWAPVASGTSLGAFRFYLKVDSREHEEEPQALSIRMRIVGDGENEDETTGVQNSEFINHNSELIYDLQGRRVTDTSNLKGIYIVNGKKIVR